MNTHADVIATLGVQPVADACQKSPAAVQKWAQRNSIPGKHWIRIAELASAKGESISLEDLASIAAGEAA